MIDRYVLVPGDMRYIQKGENTSGLVVWCRLDDLIAAGALVPVPVGEECNICDTPEDILHVLSEGEIYETGNSDGAFRVRDCKAFQCSYEWRVQPVRLLTVAEWLEEQP